MVGKKNQSALLAKYFSLYKKNPRSRVFAPLAESFRKLGMLEDAYKILREGIRQHPDYTLGYIVLAHCYYDEKKYENTYNTLRPIISKNADNISLQKIFGEACIQLGHLEEALDTFKYLLFMNPKDKYFAEQVKRLEDDLLVGHKKINLEQLIKAPETAVIPRQTTFDDDWVQVDFNRNKEDKKPPSPEEMAKELPANDEWVMHKGSLQDHPILKEDEIPERSLEDEFFADEFQEEDDIDEVNSASISTDSPLISHTLIDLYCSQHYFDKAIELLEKIIELNPGDTASSQKLKKVRQLKMEHEGQNPMATEEQGHDELISIIENKVKVKSPEELKLQEAFNHFLTLVKERAHEKNSDY